MTELVEHNDDALISQFERDVASRIRNVRHIHSGPLFVLAHGVHVGTARPVLLTITRPGDEAARKQLGEVRNMLVSVDDERLGIVIDQLWDRTNVTNGWACLATTWHEGLVPLDKALLQKANPTGDGPELPSTLLVLRTLCRQLQKIHEAGYAHGDMSVQNVSVDGEGQVHLIDFEHIVGPGLAADHRPAAISTGFGHPEKLVTMGAGPATISQHQRWDNYAVGRIFLDALTYLSPHSSPELTARTQRAIRLIGCLLLDGMNGPTERAMGLHSGFFQEEKFTEVVQAVRAIDRLLGRSRLEDVVPELHPQVGSVLEIGGYRPVPFTKRVERLLATPHMRYLGDFQQLGLISYIWATATHTRRSHAIGTFGLAVAVVESLIADPENPLVQIVMTPQRVRVTLLAALLHDVGHYPLAHDLEEAHAKAFDHERRSVQLVQSGAIAEILRESEVDDGWDVCPEDVASLIQGSPVDGASIGGAICRLLHSVISGPVDADKLDYLYRDSVHLNLRAGQGIDISRIVRSLTVSTVVPDGDNDPVLCLSVRAKARRPAELVGRIRSHMFGVAYWHHSYRAIKAMIQWVVWDALEAERSDGNRGAAARLSEKLFKDIDRRVHGQSGVGTAGASKRRLEQGERALFPLAAADPSERGALPVAEAEVLRWFAERGRRDSEVLLDLLARQTWYRAILTVEHHRNVTIGESESGEQKPVQQAWELISGIYRAPVDERPIRRLALAREVQRLIRARVEPLSEGEGSTIVYDFQSWQGRFLAASRDAQLFLIDGPDPERAFQKPLYYSVGERPGRASIEPADPIQAARSYDDRQLSQEFVASNGAIRLLCHPDHERFIQATLTQKSLFDILLLSLRTVSDG